MYSYHSSHIDSGMFTIYTGTAPKQTDEVLKVTMELMHEIGNKGMTDSELKKGKEQLKGSLILSLESTSSRMNRLGKNELMTGKHYSLDEMIERIESVQMDHVNDLTKVLLSQPFAVSMVGNSDEVLRSFRRDQLVK
ncbi:Peptidase M16 inactive domain protein [compost metagenome]